MYGIGHGAQISPNVPVNFPCVPGGGSSFHWMSSRHREQETKK